MKGLRVTEAVIIPETDLSWRAVRASGPGGQNVNKVSSKVELRLDLDATRALDDATKARLGGGEIIVTSQATRDQAKNLADARAKLAALLARALHRPKPRKPTRPTAGSRKRRLEAKQHRGRLKALRRDGDG
jgi:ribosome-associated protein